MGLALERQGQPLLVFDGAIDCLNFLLERLQLGSVAGAIAFPDLKATCPHCVASMVHVADSFASSRDQDFPKLSKTFNVIASHCVLLSSSFIVADGDSERLKLTAQTVYRLQEILSRKHERGSSNLNVLQ
ncbi:hypothetical protein ASD12_11510 [Mesorhizobium sp. Root102]|nr:hypothetical protein ASD12_11510 [Mesorhizobium sp. Root102]